MKLFGLRPGPSLAQRTNLQTGELMAHINEPAKKLRIAGKYDVLVCGGGPAGIGAALSAARNGAKTLLVEQSGFLGGMGTGALVPTFAPSAMSGAPLIKGIHAEILALLGIGDGSNDTWPPLDPEKTKYAVDRLMKTAGVEILFFTRISGVIKTGRRLEHIIVENKSGRQALKAKYFIDCTGDADVAAMSGASFKKGDRKGAMQPASNCFTVAGIDDEKFEAIRKKDNSHDLKLSDIMRSDEGKAILPIIPSGEYRFLLETKFEKGYWGFNFGHIFNVDGTDAKDLSAAAQKGREIANNFIAYARKKFPGFKNAFLVSVGQALGIRETRIIEGEYTLTVADYIKRTKFPDSIAVYDYPIDMHQTDKSLKAFNKSHKAFTQDFLLSPGEYYSIPFRALIPKGKDNLLAAGRSISCDRQVQAATRVMPLCVATGEAAGLAAAMAVKKGNRFRDTDTKLLREKLIKQSARVD